MLILKIEYSDWKPITHDNRKSRCNDRLSQISLSVVITVASIVIGGNESIVIITNGDVVKVLMATSSIRCSSHGTGALGDATEAEPLA